MKAIDTLRVALETRGNRRTAQRDRMLAEPSTPTGADRGIELSLVMYFVKPAEFLNEALASVVNQLTPATELVVIAGLRTGEETGIAPEFLPRISKLIVEPDAGGWDAANKGWRAARGTWVQFVMSDDLLPEGSIEKTLKAISGVSADIAVGGITFFEEAGQAGSKFSERPFSLDRILGELSSPAIIYRRTLLDHMGGFDGRFRYSHDRHLLLRAWLANARPIALGHETYRMRVHQGSRTMSGNTRIVTVCQTEHITFADQLLLNPSLDAGARHKLQRWRDEELVKFRITKFLASDPSLVAANPPSAKITLTRLIVASAHIVGRKLWRAMRNPRSVLDPPGTFRV